MECLHCGQGNPEDANFCSHCGKAQAKVCPSCGADADPAANFCRKCGASLAADSTVAEAAERPAAPSAERRQLTVVFCDLVGSTALSGQLDPEALREVIRAYQTAAEKVVLRYEGHIAQYLGDGLLVYFGYPTAHEDDVHRAVGASLGILSAVSLLAPVIAAKYGVDLAVRIGAHTGDVVVGEMGGETVREALAVGDTPNIAARVQDAAEPGSLVISDASHRIVHGFFDCASLGLRELRGVPAPMELHHVLRESAATTRLDVAAASGLTPLVGRDREVATLRERWDDVQGGSGHVVSLRGEAGIGKSRLLWALKEHVARDGRVWLAECQCSAHYRNSALHPILDLLENAVLRFGRDDSAAEKRDKLARLLAQHGFDHEAAFPAFAELFSITSEASEPDSKPDRELTPAEMKAIVNEGFVRLLTVRASEQPVLFVIEDLHWADPSTLELLTLVMDQAPSARLLIVVTARPEFDPTWGQRSYVTQVNLARLGAASTVDMLKHIAEDRELPPEVVEQVVAKTDGVPLFVEELLRTVIDSDMVVERDGSYELTRPLPALGIPSTLHASLAARLDRLGGAREVLQLAATVGREFTYELLRAVSPLEEAALQAHLSQLVSDEFLYTRGVPPGATYTFKHALMQDAAYGSLLRGDQRQYHQQIADALAGDAAGSSDTVPELLAYHYTEAGRTREAVDCWHRAGVRANARAASLEAVSHLNAALDVLRVLPESAETREQEFETLTELGPALIASSGYAAPAVKQTYTRALELSRLLGEHSAHTFRALSGLWKYYMSRGPLNTARELAEQLLATAEDLDDPRLMVSACAMLADVLSDIGDFSATVEHGQAGIALDRADILDAGAPRPKDDAGIMCRIWTAWALWRQGHTDEARTLADEALALGLSHSSAHVRAEAWMYATAFYRSSGELDLCAESCEEFMALADEFGFPAFRAVGEVVEGWLRACRGEAAGVDRVRAGIDAWRATGSRVVAPPLLGMLAEGCLAAERTDEGLAAVAEAIEFSVETGAMHYACELYRLRAELLLQRGDADHGAGPDEAEQSFRQAMDMAREQRAKTYELRAAMGMARMWRTQGRTAEARRLLDDVYAWFPDGVDTPDLREARALRQALS